MSVLSGAPSVRVAILHTRCAVARCARSTRTLCTLDRGHKTEVFNERQEVLVAKEKLKLVFNAVRCNENIDRLPDRRPRRAAMRTLLDQVLALDMARPATRKRI